tara:strand:+ start:1207 stop:1422 length:216 start_codon:yes stop_codon:yes gene_type:complete
MEKKEKKEVNNIVLDDINISKNKLLERLNIEFHLRYHQYSEGSLPEDSMKRILKGEGFLIAMNIITNFTEE